MSGLANSPPVTARQLAEKLLGVENPDAPVFFWAPGEYWEPQPGPHNHALHDGRSFVMVEMNIVTRAAVQQVSV